MNIDRIGLGYEKTWARIGNQRARKGRSDVTGKAEVVQPCQQSSARRMLLTSCLDIEEFFSAKLPASSYLRVLVFAEHLTSYTTLGSLFSSTGDQSHWPGRQSAKVSIIGRAGEVGHDFGV